MGCRWIVTAGVVGEDLMNILMRADDELLLLDDDSRMQLQTSYHKKPICIVDHLKDKCGYSWPSLCWPVDLHSLSGKKK